MKCSHLKIQPLVILICMLCTIFFTQAQQTAKTSATKTQTKDNTCGCDYLPLCNWEQTKIFAGKTYKGYANEEGEMEWYNCENGVVTKKWTETYYPEDISSSYNPFLNEKTVYHTTGPAQKIMQTQIILKYNLSEGVKWSQEVTEQSGLINTHHWTIIKKGFSIEVDGITYNNVIKVRYSTKANDLYNLPGFFYYYAKGEGQIKEEREPQKEQKTLIMEEIAKTEAGLKSRGEITGTIDKELVGKWQLPAANKNENPLLMDLFENGIGALYYESTEDDNAVRNFKNMFSGKKTDGKTYFIWRIDNGWRLIWLDEFLNVKKIQTYKFTRLIDPASKKPAIKIANDTYISINKPKWQTPVEEPSVAIQSLVKTLKGSIDHSIVGSWKYMINLGGGFFQPAIYTFKQDGTYEYFLPNSMSTTDQSKNKFYGHWRVDGDFIELLRESKDGIDRAAFRKVNDQKTSKPKIVIRFSYPNSNNYQDREYETQDNKKPW